MVVGEVGNPHSLEQPLETGAVSGLLDHNTEWTNSWICTTYPFELPCNNLCEKGTLLVMWLYNCRALSRSAPTVALVIQLNYMDN